jgi:hypothetical protein
MYEIVRSRLSGRVAGSIIVKIQVNMWKSDDWTAIGRCGLFIAGGFVLGRRVILVGSRSVEPLAIVSVAQE